MIGVKEDQIKELNIYPFELAPTEVAKDDQLMIPQHPLTRDYQQPTPMGISLGPCKNIMGNSCVLRVLHCVLLIVKLYNYYTDPI